MTEPTPTENPAPQNSVPENPEPKPKARRQLSEMLTVDDLINLAFAKARSRRGRLALTTTGVVLATGIVLTPLLTRSSQAAGPSTTPTLPIVTESPTTDGPTTRVESLLPPINVRVNDSHRYGLPRTTTTIPKATTVPTAKPGPTPVTAAAPAQPSRPARGSGTVPPPTAAPVLTVPPDGGITVPIQ